jgi:HK97 family phage portal protein
MLTFGTPGSTPDRPICLINEAREAIANSLTYDRFEGRFFSNGARPSFVLETDRMFPDEATANRLRSQIERVMGGEDNAYKVAVLELGLKLRELSVNNEQSQLVELRKHNNEQISRVFRVNPAMIGDTASQSYSNYEQAARQFVADLLPWLALIEAAIARVIFTDEEQRTHFVEIQTAELLRGDLASRFEGYRNAVGGSFMTPNEIRQRENLPPVVGGDVLLRQPGQESAPAAEAAA